MNCASRKRNLTGFQSASLPKKTSSVQNTELFILVFLFAIFSQHVSTNEYMNELKLTSVLKWG